jgi:2-polyprenyl-3-methyl-5-hydroxy-6-metoxy-1,4-benzoquinol methylase
MQKKPPGDRIGDCERNTGTSIKLDNEAARFFHRFSKTFDTFYDGQRSPVLQWFDRHFRSDMFIRFERTFEVFGDLTGRSLLDIGCGSGVYVVEALRRGATTVTAMDPAANMLQLVRNRLAREGFSNQCAVTEGLFPQVCPAPHDHVIVMGVMDYVKDSVGFLMALRPVVKISAAISFPSRHWFRTPVRKVRYALRNCPVYFYNLDKIERMTRTAGFSSVVINKIPGAGMDYHAWLRP